jgi:hypothetical protein
MKKEVLFITVVCLLLSGCANENLKDLENGPFGTKDSIGIIVRAASVDNSTKKSVNEPIVFTGNDMLWFNESTKEIRFKDNVSKKAAFSNVQTLKFFILDDYLFSSKVSVNSSSVEIINSLVFYYNTAENKYYLLDGYPPEKQILIPNDATGIQNERTENMHMIAAEWNKFITQLKKDGKHTN